MNEFNGDFLKEGKQMKFELGVKPDRLAQLSSGV